MSEDALAKVVTDADVCTATTSEVELENDADKCTNNVSESLTPHSTTSPRCDAESDASPSENTVSTPRKRTDSGCWNLNNTITQATPILAQLSAATAVNKNSKVFFIF